MFVFILLRTNTKLLAEIKIPLWQLPRQLTHRPKFHTNFDMSQNYSGELIPVIFKQIDDLEAEEYWKQYSTRWKQMQLFYQVVSFVYFTDLSFVYIVLNIRRKISTVTTLRLPKKGAGSHSDRMQSTNKIIN